MHAIGFGQANQILKPPAGMTQDQCTSLEVFSDGEYCISRWQLNDEDLEELKRNGGKIYIAILFGGTMPPIRPTVTTPFE